MNAFIENLIATTSDQNCRNVVIVDDNAQLSLEHRLKNSESFAASMTTDHQTSRWSSQPSLHNPRRTSSLLNASNHRVRCNSLAHSASRSNASWDIQSNETSSPVSTLPRMDREESTQFLRGRSGMLEYTHRISSMPLMTAMPKLPERYKSPHSSKPSTNASFASLVEKTGFGLASSISETKSSQISTLRLKKQAFGGSMALPASSRAKSASSTEGIRNALGSLAPPTKRTISSSVKDGSLQKTSTRGRSTYAD